ncbi:MAG TPA: VTT domain-containing protein [Actinomycetes bacterium]|nr:VTT domain-containing protein [Actinomycetes bacterium]
MPFTGDLAAALAPLTVAPSGLGPDWLDPQHLLDGVGLWAVVIVGVILFAECGLLVGFFLPGDSLLFTAGLLISSGALKAPLWLLLVVGTVAAVAGNLVGYWIGREAGPAIFNKPNSRLFRQEYVDKTYSFFDHYGSRAIVLARFVPIVRTFITVMAGVGKMDFRRYATFTAIGGVLWAAGVTVLGYFLGQVAFIRDNLEMIFLAIVAISVIPIAIELMRHRSRRPAARAAAQPDAQPAPVEDPAPPAG